MTVRRRLGFAMGEGVLWGLGVGWWYGFSGVLMLSSTPAVHTAVRERMRETGGIVDTERSVTVLYTPT